mgnify:CR=1 FL=1
MLCGSFFGRSTSPATLAKKKYIYIYKMCFLIMIGNIHNSLYFHFENNVL